MNKRPLVETDRTEDSKFDLSNSRTTAPVGNVYQGPYDQTNIDCDCKLALTEGIFRQR